MMETQFQEMVVPLPANKSLDGIANGVMSYWRQYAHLFVEMDYFLETNNAMMITPFQVMAAQATANLSPASLVIRTHRLDTQPVLQSAVIN